MRTCAAAACDAMNKKTRAITKGALLTAFSAAFIYFASIFPSGQLGITAAASLFCAAAVVEIGLRGGAAVYIATLLLGLILTADKTPIILYGLFLGYYPIIKSISERQKSRIIEWAIKMAVMNASLTLIVLIFETLVFRVQSLTKSLAVIYLTVNIVYIIFDFGVSKIIGFYITNISKLTGRKR